MQSKGKIIAGILFVFAALFAAYAVCTFISAAQYIEGYNAEMAVGSATTGQPYAPVTFLQSLTVYANGVPTLFYALILLAAGWIVMALNRKGAAAQADDFEDDFDDELDELGLEDEDAEEYLTEGRDLSLDEETTSLETEFDHTADEVNEETEQAEADSKKNRFSKKDDSATE